MYMICKTHLRQVTINNFFIVLIGGDIRHRLGGSTSFSGEINS